MAAIRTRIAYTKAQGQVDLMPTEGPIDFQAAWEAKLNQRPKRSLAGASARQACAEEAR
jgi:hypothetical protein